MKYILSGTSMKQVDDYSINTIGIPSLVLMERAALATVQEILTVAKKNDLIVAVCGSGNNGADGVAIARILHIKGYNTCVYMIGNKQNYTKELVTQLSIYKNIDGEVYEFQEEPFLDKADIIVDAIFGVGLSRGVEGIYAKAVHSINNSQAVNVSVDIPSGINADNAAVLNCAVKADITVTFGSAKTGIILYPGTEYAGKMIVADIGFPQKSYKNIDELMYYYESTDIQMIPKRSNYSNKGTFGKLLIIAGNDDMSGAAYMCAKSAFRMGIGMVNILTTNANKAVLQKMIPEAMITTYRLDNFDKESPPHQEARRSGIEELERVLNWADVVAVGPGIGIGKVQNTIIDKVLDSKIPTVIDADGINSLSENSHIKAKLHKEVIITPHVGEMSRFCGKTIKEILENLIGIAKENADKYNITCVLKDARTVISENQKTYINISGNNGMATAGSGDVLTGIIAALLAKGMKCIDAASIGAYIHGIAGDLAAKEQSKTSIMATDIIDKITEIAKMIEDEQV